MKIRAIYGTLAVFVLSGCSDAGSTPKLSGGWLYPGATLDGSEPLQGVLDGTRSSYASSDDGEDIKVYYLKHILSIDWDIDQVVTRRLHENSFHNFSLVAYAPDRNAMYQIQVINNEAIGSKIFISHIPDLEAVAQEYARNATKNVGGDLAGNRIKEVIKDDAAPRHQRPRYTDDIMQYVNEGDYDALFNLGSDFYRSRRAPEFFANSLPGITIERFELRRSNLQGDFCVEIIDYKTTQDGRTEYGLCLMFWTRKNGQWSYENLPVLDSGLPEKLLKVFE